MYKLRPLLRGKWKSKSNLFIGKIICHRYRDWAPDADFDQREKPVCEHTKTKKKYIFIYILAVLKVVHIRLSLRKIQFGNWNDNVLPAPVSYNYPSHSFLFVHVIPLLHYWVTV